MLPLQDFSEYFYENKAVDYPNQLQITSLCNAKCIFCSNEQNPFEIKRAKFRSLEEIEKILWSINYLEGSIALNESLPGRLSEGEALIHPQFFEILALIRNKFNNLIRITTNASLLDEMTISKIAIFNPFQITISLPTVNKEYWMQTFNLTEKHYETAIKSFDYLNNTNINVYATIIPMPSWVGYNDIENTIKFLANKGCRNILIYAPGYTKYTKKEVVPKLIYDKQELSYFFSIMTRKYDVSFDWNLEPNRELNINYDFIYNILKSSYNNKRKKITWFTSNAAHERFSNIVKQITKNINVENNILPVDNLVYGGNIECTGLWMIEDIKSAIEKYSLENEYIVLPSNFLDKYGFDLMGNNIVDFIKTQMNFLQFS